MLTIIGFIFLGLIIFVGAGIFGWILELLGYVFKFLLEGFTKSLGCLFWVFIIFCILVVLFC